MSIRIRHGFLSEKESYKILNVNRYPISLDYSKGFGKTVDIHDDKFNINLIEDSILKRFVQIIPFMSCRFFMFTSKNNYIFTMKTRGMTTIVYEWCKWLKETNTAVNNKGELILKVDDFGDGIVSWFEKHKILRGYMNFCMIRNFWGSEDTLFGCEEMYLTGRFTDKEIRSNNSNKKNLHCLKVKIKSYSSDGIDTLVKKYFTQIENIISEDHSTVYIEILIVDKKEIFDLLLERNIVEFIKEKRQNITEEEAKNVTVYLAHAEDDESLDNLTVITIKT